MALAKWKPKDPQDVRDYWIDFTSLLASDETITAATVAVPIEQPLPDAPFLLLAIDDDDFTDKMVRARFSGGINATKYAVQYHVTTSTGQQFDLTKTLEVKERTA